VKRFLTTFTKFFPRKKKINENVKNYAQFFAKLSEICPDGQKLSNK